MKKILVPVDFNPLAAAALRHAAQLAQSSGATLIVMYADTFDPPAEFTAEQTGARRARLPAEGLFVALGIIVMVLIALAIKIRML